ncbi:MAG: glucokinase [Pseudomonadota bacterium]
MGPDAAPLFLVADIGGTNTRVALSDGPSLRTDTVRRYKNSAFDGLEAVLSAFMQDFAPCDVEGACIAVAGPVRDGKAHLTNRDWAIDADTVARPTGAKIISVLNDLAAQGHALGHIDEDQLRWLAPGVASASPDRLVIGVGTGFNCAPVHDGAFGRLVSAAEAGHANLPIRTEEDLELLRFVETAHGFPAIEDVLSGRGLERVDEWLSIRAGTPEKRSGADIVAACKAGSDARADHAVRIFTRMLGTVAGNLSLVHLPFGGVFLIGGVVQALAPLMIPMGFSAAFTDKGRFSDFMEQFPIAVVEDDYAALVGCAACLSRQIQMNSS